MTDWVNKEEGMTEETGIEVANKSTDESVFSGLPEDVLSRLDPSKVRMILLYLTGQYTQKKIGQIIGVSDSTIRAWSLNPDVQYVIRELQAREFAVIESSIRAMRFKALGTMDELMDSTMDNVRYQAAKDTLDRSGHAAQKTIKVDKTVTTVEQQLASLVDFTIDDDDVIDVDIDDLLSEVKNGR